MQNYIGQMKEYLESVHRSDGRWYCMEDECVGEPFFRSRVVLLHMAGPNGQHEMPWSGAHQGKKPAQHEAARLASEQLGLNPDIPMQLVIQPAALPGGTIAVAAALPPLSACLLGVEAERHTTQPAGPNVQPQQSALASMAGGSSAGPEPPNAGRFGEEYAVAGCIDIYIFHFQRG